MCPAPARLPGTWNLVPESSPGQDPGLAGPGGPSRPGADLWYIYNIYPRYSTNWIDKKIYRTYSIAGDTVLTQILCITQQNLMAKFSLNGQWQCTCVILEKLCSSKLYAIIGAMNIWSITEWWILNQGGVLHIIFIFSNYNSNIPQHKQNHLPPLTFDFLSMITSVNVSYGEEWLKHARWFNHTVALHGFAQISQYY